MKYNCTTCNYSSNDKSNFNRHLKSKAHIQIQKSVNRVNRVNRLSKIDDNENKVSKKNTTTEKCINNKNFYCDACNTYFSSAPSLSRHKNKRCKNIESLDSEKNNTVMNDILIQLKQTTEINKELLNYIKNTKHFTNNTTYNISIKKYVEQNYSDAPAIAKLDDYTIIENDDSDLLNNIIYNYNHKMLDKYLGDFLVKYYKKDDCMLQSIWNSDVARMTYIIKELLANNKSLWNHDYKGLKTKEYIINPMLDYIKKYITEYIHQSSANIQNLSTKDCRKLIEKQVVIGQIFQYIDTELADDIVKYIGPHFQLNKSCNLFISNNEYIQIPVTP